MKENICKFVPTRSANEGINIVNFVYEREASFPKKFIVSSTYSVGLVTRGSGMLHTVSGEFPLQDGSLFVLFPAKPYFIENTGNLEYAYISFVGRRAIGLFERTQVTVNRPVCGDCAFLQELWKSAFSAVTDENIDMLCEGLVLYTLSFLCREKESGSAHAPSEGILQVKQFVDLHYTETGLNLKTVSERFSYHPKYLSATFKKMVKVNFSEYLCARRLEHACRLIESGVENVNQLAEQCGYSDPLYFSKAFKNRYGVPPKKYITERSHGTPEEISD